MPLLPPGVPLPLPGVPLPLPATPCVHSLSLACTPFHAAAQMERFRAYLRHKCVHVDVWDGASLLPIGTGTPPTPA